MDTGFLRYNSDHLQRLGVLKMLVAVLDAQRRSTAVEGIIRKLAPLVHGRTEDGQARAEYLIRRASGSSWNFRFTEANVKQILEWARLVGLVGSGNQITERGLLLRHLMGEEVVSSILAGDLEVNPFELSAAEKLYFLYLHFELDSCLYFLIKRIAELPSDQLVRGMEANRTTCFALYDLFSLMSESRNSSKVLLAQKNLRELIGRMVAELDLSVDIPIAPVVKPRPATSFKRKPEQRDKKRTKTSDQEAIPRFELLVDLGLLTKKVTAEDSDEEKARKSWKYWPTATLAGLSSKLPKSFDPHLCWNHFAQSASDLVCSKAVKFDPSNNAPAIARRAYWAYTKVKRPFGHTPIESVGIITMISALTDSEIIEVKDVHALFLDFKREDLFSDTVHYAAGNDLEKMFIDIKPNFIAEVESYYGKEK